MPALLTGSYARYPQLPTWADYPQNLFTLLEGAYDFEVFESTTQLCPDRMCETHENLKQRLESLLRDLSAVYLAIVIPEDMADGLPDVRNAWRDFSAREVEIESEAKEGGRRAFVRENRYADRALLFRTFLGSLRQSARPTLNFLHINLPHMPYYYLPSGKTYTPGPVDGLIGWADWTDDKWLIAQAYQRYLLQVGYVDTLVGELITRLKHLNLYDRSLLVVTADHGVSFRPNGRRRHVTETNIRDLMAIPLFIKIPDQQEGFVSDRHVQLIDVLPTILDVLDVPVPWEMDGVSAIRDTFPERNELTLLSAGGKRFVVEPAAIQLSDTLKWKPEWFGSGRWPYALPRAGPHRELVGRKVDEIGVADTASMVVALDQGALFDDVKPNSRFLPARIIGTILRSKEPVDNQHFAVVVNGTVHAVTKASQTRGRLRKFSAMVPETAFRGGNNKVEVFLVSAGTNRQALLRRVSRDKFPAPRLARINPSRTSEGRQFQINERTVFPSWVCMGRIFSLEPPELCSCGGLAVVEGINCLLARFPFPPRIRVVSRTSDFRLTREQVFPSWVCMGRIFSLEPRSVSMDALLLKRLTGTTYG